MLRILSVTKGEDFARSAFCLSSRTPQAVHIFRVRPLAPPARRGDIGHVAGAPSGLPRREEGWVKPLASMPQISRVSKGWAYEARPRLRG